MVWTKFYFHTIMIKHFNKTNKLHNVILMRCKKKYKKIQKLLDNI